MPQHPFCKMVLKDLFTDFFPGSSTFRMRKKILPYIIAFVLLIVVLLFFSRAYREMTSYSELTNRHNAVNSSFHNLSRQLNNAAILNPDLVKVGNAVNGGKLFYTDSLVIIQQLTLLKSAVDDSINIQIVEKLDPAVRSELSWLLNSNVPDSIILHRSSGHIASFQRIDSLINQGIQRTTFLLKNLKTHLNEEINTLRIWMTVFILLSGGLLIYTSINLFRQRSKTTRKEKELETVFNRINDAVVSVDNEWRYTFLNDAALATHPLSRDKTLGQVIWDVHPEMKGTIFWDKYHEAMNTRQVVEIESHYAPMDIWFSVKVYPSGDGLTIFYKDITGSKRAEQKLSETLKEVTDYKFALDEANIVAITDQKGIITYVNDNFCHISKFSREELIGQDHRIINSGHHPKEFIRSLWLTITNGKIWKGELKNKAKDGTVYWVDTTIVPFLNEEGKPYQYVAIRADITERKKLEEQHVLFGSIVNSSDDAILSKTLEGKIISWNHGAEKVFGYSSKEIIGEQISILIPPDLQNEENEILEKIRNGQDVDHYETRRVRKDGQIIYVSLSISPIRDSFGNITGASKISRDITGRKKAEKEIQELNEELEQRVAARTAELNSLNNEMEAFTYSVSHDLRAPLRGIIGFTSILEEDYASQLDDEAKRITSVIRSNTLRMGRLIDDLLAFSRTGKQELVKTRINTNAMVAEIINDMAHQKESSNAIQWDIRDLPPIIADLNTIRQVWINLVSNAIKYSATRNHPHIEIAAKSVNGQVVFNVKDNGVGFDENYKHKLFKVFQRLHSAEEFEGTGVGLALVEKIVSKHGGKVWAESKANEGACFSFSLPV